MKIYEAEASIAELIQEQNSIAYCQPVRELAQHPIQISDKIAAEAARLEASSKDPDLFFHTSILVSTVWNKNDDVFAPASVWAARHSPEDKPTNIGHQHEKIVGHMTGNWAINEDGTVIADDSNPDSLPNKFHILNSAVIYKMWKNEELQAQVDDLIEKIQAGEMYVSMECLFSAFDYAIEDEEKGFRVLERGDATAYLTKHLRCYGGTGQFEFDGKAHKLGRIPRNIVFSGKGYVENPANEESVIFSGTELFSVAQTEKKEPKSNFSVISVEAKTSKPSNSIGNIKMDQIAKLEATVKELEDRLAKADVAKLETQIADLAKERDEAVAKLEVASEKLETLVSEKDMKEKEFKKFEKAKSDLEAENASLQESLAKIEAEKVAASRLANLVDSGIEKSEAEKLVDSFSELDDDKFQLVTKASMDAAKLRKELEAKLNDKNAQTQSAASTEDSTEDSDVEDKTGAEAADNTDLDSGEENKDADLSANAETQAETLRTQAAAFWAEQFKV